MHTHHIDPFTNRDTQGREQAVCGRYITGAEVAPAETLPTCAGCRMWVQNLDFIAPEPVSQARRAASDVMEAVCE